MMSYLMGLDVGLFHLTNVVWTTSFMDAVMPALSWAGNLGAVWFVLLGSIAAFGKKTGRRVAFAGLVALALGFASSEIMKELTMRPRPFLTLPDVRLVVNVPHSYAFPSGHTASAFAAATGVAFSTERLLGKVPPWSWAMLALAVAIAYSRMYVGVHWPTDVLGGVILGLASGWVGVRVSWLRWRRQTARKDGETQTILEDAREVESVLER